MRVVYFYISYQEIIFSKNLYIILPLKEVIEIILAAGNDAIRRIFYNIICCLKAIDAINSDAFRINDNTF